jgi:hypothetical protein
MPSTDIDGTSADMYLPVVFQSPLMGVDEITSFIEWSEGRVTRQPNRKGPAFQTSFTEFCKTASPFFAGDTTRRKLTMCVRDNHKKYPDSGSYNVTITIPHFDICDYKSLSNAFNGYHKGLYDWLYDQFERVLAAYIGEAKIHIRRTGRYASRFTDSRAQLHSWLKNVVGSPDTKHGPLNGIVQYAYYRAGFTERFIKGRFTWVSGPSTHKTNAHGADLASTELTVSDTESPSPIDDSVTPTSIRNVINAIRQNPELLTDEVLKEFDSLTKTTQPSPSTTPLDSAIQIISDTALVNPGLFSSEHIQAISRVSKYTFASPADAQLLHDTSGIADADDGPDIGETWENTAFTLNRIYEERNAAFPDECVCGPELAPAHSSRFHLIRFANTAAYFKGKLVKPSSIREYLCETDDGKEDLEAAGLIAVPTKGRATSRFWILDAKQIKRVMAKARVVSPEKLPANLLERCKLEVDHLLNNQQFGRRSVLLACDTLLNYCLIPRWLNVHVQFLHTYSPAKMAMVGVVGHTLLRIYMIALNNGKAQRIREKLTDLFANPLMCQRDELSRSIKRVIGAEIVSESFAKQLSAAIAAFQPNEIACSSRGQRRIDSMLKRKRDLEEVDAASEEDESDDERLAEI